MSSIKILAVALCGALMAASCTGSDETAPSVVDESAPSVAGETAPAAEDETVTYGDVAAAEAASAKAAVEQAIDHYDAEGLDAALELHNSPDSIEGERYVFVVDADSGEMIGHWDEQRRGYSLYDWLGTDLYGFEFGTEMMSADEGGKWVTYTFVPPDALAAGSFAEGNLHIKHSWVQRHDGLLFGSGWYMDARGFIEAIVDAAADVVAAGVTSDITSQLDLGGLADAIGASMAYYNATPVHDGFWLGFVASRDGLVVSAEHNPELVGTNISDFLGTAVLERSDDDGQWITETGADAAASSINVYARSAGDLVIAAGWYSDDR